MNLPHFSIQRPVTIMMFFMGIMVLGLLSLSRLPVELMPNNKADTITIRVGIRGGLPPVEVESRVTRIIEEAVSGVTNLKNMSSISKEGESTISLEFEAGTDMDFTGLEVREKYSRIKNKLPKEIEKPIIAKFSRSDVPILILTLSSFRRTPEMLRKLVDDDIKEKFMRVNGVANIDVGGGRERKIVVDIDEKKLLQYELSIHNVVNIITVNNMNLLVGSIKKENHRYLLRTIGYFKDIEEIKQLPISQSSQGSLIKILDIATVRDTFLEPKGFARLNLKPVVSLYVQKESSANTVKTVRGILALKKKLRKIIPADIKIKVINNQSEKIEEALIVVRKALINGALLAVIILFCFLQNLKATFIVGSSIPISVVATFVCMGFSKHLGLGEITINVMTLSGLALGIGMLVDSAIVVLENITKYKEQDSSDIQASLLGAQEMVISIMASTLTTVIVFLPIIFLNEGIRLEYSGLAFTVTFSLFSSLLVSISLIPMLFSRLNQKFTFFLSFLISLIALSVLLKKYHRDLVIFYLICLIVFILVLYGTINFFYKKELWFKKKYRRFLFLLMRYRKRLFLLLIVSFAISIHHFKKLDKDLKATGTSNKFTTFIELPSGAKLEKSNETVREVERMLRETPEIENYSSRVEGWSSKIYVTLIPKFRRNKSIQQIIDELRVQVKHFRDAFIYFQRENEGEKKEINLNIYGQKPKEIKDIAEMITQRMGQIPEFKDPRIRMREGRPEMHILLDRTACRNMNLSIKKVSEGLHAKISGLRASTYSTEGKEIEIVARVRLKDRDKFAEIKKLAIPIEGGKHITLDQVANFNFELGPSEIWRKNRRRTIQVSATRRISLSKSVEKVEGIVASIKFPEGCSYSFGDDYIELQKTSKEILFAILLTIILIYLVLASLFESYYQPFIILLTVPLALIGVIFILKWRKVSLTMGSMIGFIMLGGIVVNNAIILIDTVNKIMRETQLRSLRCIVLATQSRMRPILMTTFTTILGLLPMSLDKSSSSQLWAPLAITVIIGLSTSTFLTLFVLPCIFILFEEISHFFLRLFRREIGIFSFFKKKKSSS